MRVTPEELERRSETLELINAEIAGRLQRQLDSGAKIDTKATALAGYAVAAAAFLATRHPQVVLASFAYVAFAGALGSSIWAFAVGTYRDVPNPRRLFNGYATEPKPAVLASLAAERVKSFEVNARRHKFKAQRWHLSLMFLTAGATLMIISILVQ
jgi:hypothetical protein